MLLTKCQTHKHMQPLIQFTTNQTNIRQELDSGCLSEEVWVAGRSDGMARKKFEEISWSNGKVL